MQTALWLSKFSADLFLHVNLDTILESRYRLFNGGIVVLIECLRVTSECYFDVGSRITDLTIWPLCTCSNPSYPKERLMVVWAWMK